MGLKLKLNPEPTFKAKVGIPVPGGKPTLVEFTFKHRTREQVKELQDEMAALGENADEAEAFRMFVVGWELDDEFNDENIKRLLSNYLGASAAISSAYFSELYGARRGN